MAEGNWAKTCPACGHRYRWVGAMHPEPPCPDCKRRAEAEKQRKSPAKAGSVRIPTSAGSKDLAAEAIELCDEIDSMADDVPDRGADFADSVRTKAAEIRETVEERNSATPGQISALENMRDGLARWIHD